jgi:endonuclease/exonuclease/phosphatase family metal-dependent hydrolase
MNRYLLLIKIIGIFFIAAVLVSCSSADVFRSNSQNTYPYHNDKKLSLVTYNIKAIYKREELEIDKVIDFINEEKYDFVVFQELFNESTRDYIIENTDTNIYRSIVSRVDYNSFPEFIFQDAGLFMMGTYPLVDLSSIEFCGDIYESNGVIHMILEKEISKTNDFLANKSVLGALYEINDSTKLFLFTTHVQAIGSQEHKNFQLEQIREFITEAVTKVVESNLVDQSENLAVVLAGDFNSNAYSPERFAGFKKHLGYPRDLHMEHNGNKQEFTFKFRSRPASRRYDYILSYDKIDSLNLKRVETESINAIDVKDDNNVSISDHFALRTVLILN